MIKETKGFPIEKWFLFIALFVGSILIFLVPPMASPDENDHFYNAIAFSEANWLPEIKGDMRGRILPNCIIDFVNSYNSRFAGDLSSKYNFGEAYTNWAVECDFQQRSFVEYWNSNVSLLAYFPSGIGITLYRGLAKIFHFIVMSPYNFLMVGRFCNLIFYSFFVYFAIKWTPVMKKTMFFIALLPMSIFLASTLSYDTVIIACSLLLFSKSLKIMSEDNIINIQDLLIICFCTSMCFSVKQAYIPLLIILLAIPIRKFGNIKKFIKYVCITIASGVIPYGIFTIGKAVSEKDFLWKYADAMEKQKNVLLSQPICFGKNIINSFVKVGDFYIVSMFGCLGQLDTNLPILMIYLLAFMLVIVSIFEISTQKIITIKFKLMSFLGVALSIYAMFAGTYIIWTSTRYSIGLDYVEGVQGRYFIPLFLWAIILFSNQRLESKVRLDDIFTKLVIGVSIYSMFITLLCILLRYWI